MRVQGEPENVRSICTMWIHQSADFAPDDSDGEVSAALVAIEDVRAAPAAASAAAAGTAGHFQNQKKPEKP